MRKIVLPVVTGVIGAAAGAATVGMKMNEIVEKKEMNSEKFRIMYRLMEHWMRIKQRGESLEKYFNAYGYKRIAIYGMAEIGRLLLDELKNTDIEIVYGIDKNPNATDRIDIIAPEDDLPEVDVIVVTAIAYFDEIEELLSKNSDIPVISMESVVYEVF